MVAEILYPSEIDMQDTVGDLNRRQAMWMQAHAHHLAERVPSRNCRWRWSDVELTHGELAKLRDAGLIEQVERDWWRTTDRCIQAICDYGRLERDAVGCRAGQLLLDGP